MKARNLKTALLLSLVAILTLPMGACEKSETAQLDVSHARTRENALNTAAKEDTSTPSGLRDLDLGQNWDANVPDRGFARPGRASAAAEEPAWVVLLGTFTGATHRQAAETMAAAVRNMDPAVRDARVEQSDAGSIVVVGRFAAPTDPEAKRTLQQVKSIRQMQRPVFKGAMLTRIGKDHDPTHPHDLRTVQQTHSTRDQLYTLGVATWIEIQDDQNPSFNLTWEDARKAAEAHAARLRAQGYPAYFHHDENRHISDVTVGIFGSEAFDPRSGLVSPEVSALQHKFENRLYNGDIMWLAIDPNRKIDPKHPERNAKPAKPLLVVVPMD